MVKGMGKDGRGVHLAGLGGALLALLGGVAGCGDEVARTQVMVFVDADPGVRAEAQTLEVDVFGRAESGADWTEVRAIEVPAPGFPYLVALVPANGDVAREFRLVARALDGEGDPVARAEAISGYLRERTLALTVRLSDTCAPTQCPEEGFTCRRGACVDAQVDPSTLEPYQPGMPPGQDSGVDAGADGGRSDGGAEADGGAGDGGTGDGGGGTDADAPECTGDVCAEDTLSVCEGGRFVRDEPCPLGCAGADRCADVDPNNGLGAALDAARTGPDVVLADGATIDTDTGEVMDGGGESVDVPSTLLSAPAGGVAIRVFEVGSLRAGDVRVTGGPAFAVASDGEIVLEGVLDAGGHDYARGPGALARGSGIGCWGASVPLASGWPGAGGAGHESSGGRGGSAGGATGGAAGQPHGMSTIVPLLGGCDGGAVLASDGGETVRAGRGGGAVQLVSRTGITITGGILATGGGGDRSTFGAPQYIGGAGGGSGGAVFLEAPVVSVEGQGISTNGGSGSCGGGMNGEAGRDGGFGTAAAAGGVCVDADRGDGGDGGAATFGATQGEAADFVGGGGGGERGRIRILTRDGTVEGAGVVSPAPLLGEVSVR